jgi:hypothetical protein
MEMFYSSVAVEGGSPLKRPSTPGVHGSKRFSHLVINRHPLTEVRNMTDRFGPLTFVMATAFLSTLVWLSAMVAGLAH